MALSDLKRAWILRQLGLSSSTLSESDLLTQIYADQSFNAGTRRVKIPMPPAGQYFFPLAPVGQSTNSGLGNSVLRVAPWVVEDKLSIDRIGADISVAGEAGSKLRLGIFAADLTTGLKPDALVLDAGQVNGDSATVQELVCDVTLGPGIYFIGGAVQSAPVTQPTVRIHSVIPDIPLALGTGMPGVNPAVSAFTLAGVAGAFPASVSAASASAGMAPRLFVRVK